MLKKHVILFSGLLILAGCSQNEESNQSSVEAAAESADDLQRAPNISPTAAPGVAFNYRYAFELADKKIASVQEEHAAACETLGLSKCRITGMQYTLVNKDHIEASLAFKLDPLIARKFGKDAIASVTKAQGILTDSQITGEDVGTGISASQRRSSDLNAEISSIEKRLAAGGLGDRERSELQSQLAGLKEQSSSERSTQKESAAMLASTPMTFSYSSGGGIFGSGGVTISQAGETAMTSFSTMISFILLALGVLLPWLLLGAVIVALWRTPPIRKVRAWLRPQKSISDIDNTEKPPRTSAVVK
jgi:hypothetical protein